MSSLILTSATRYLFPIMLLFSFYILLRGHNLPGGGFIGGLLASAAYILYAIANGIDDAKKLMKVNPFYLIPVGLMIVILSGFIGFVVSGNFLEGVWMKGKFPMVGHIGTPLLFDFGVYLVVIGIVLKIIFTLFEEEIV